MTKSNCLYCGEKLESPYKFSYKYCPDTNHKELHAKKELTIITCIECKYEWKPRKAYGPPPYCPRCKSYNYGKEFVKDDTVSFEICHKCGGQKNTNRIVCSSCMQPNTSANFYCGIPKKYYKAFMDFLKVYPGDQKDVLELQYRLFGNIPDNEEEEIVKILEPELKLEIAKDEDTQTLSIAEETIEEMVNPIAELEEPVPTEKPIPTEKKASKGEIEVLEESEALAALDGLEWG